MPNATLITTGSIPVPRPIPVHTPATIRPSTTRGIRSYTFAGADRDGGGGLAVLRSSTMVPIVADSGRTRNPGHP
ncbi:hypothetical protein GCM10010411_86420 [Actinomadura fulvescens]|uniref:Uncharacterized protein n=1 Tax=Actinomadura fulvescens TaxID=46160 RepID=A0ABP6D5I5_9ACTN